jgi:hypothetical protein
VPRMVDLVMVALTIAFFGLSFALVRWLERV